MYVFFLTGHGVFRVCCRVSRGYADLPQNGSGLPTPQHRERQFLGGKCPVITSQIQGSCVT